MGRAGRFAPMIVLACLAALAALLLIGAGTDIWVRRLPNWLTASVAGLYFLYVVASPFTVDWIGALAVASIVFVAGFALFAFNVMGGGDVKLIAGLALWAGVDLIALFLLITALAGGLMSFGVLLFQRLGNHPVVIGILPYLAVTMQSHLGFSLPLRRWGGQPDLSQEDQAAGSLPYGVAIAAGGFAVIYAILNI